MSNPTDTFPSDLDPEAFLARMYGGGLFMPWGASPTPNRPSLANSIAAMDAGPPSLPRSLIAMGYALPTATPDPSLQPTLGPQEMLFGGLGWPADTNAPATSPTVTPNRPSLANSIAALDAGPPSLARSLIAMGYAPPTATPDPSLQPTLGPQEMLFGGPGLPSSSNGPSVGPNLIPTGFSTPSPPPTGPQAGDPSLIPAQANSTPMTGPRAISRPIGEPSAMPADPYDIRTRAYLARPQMSLLQHPPSAASYDPASENWRGHELVLPDGSTIADSDIATSRSPTGHVMTPYLNLDEVAAAGRQVGEGYRSRLAHYGEDSDISREFFAWHALRDVATGGRFDYQRKGNQFAGLAAHFLSDHPRAFQFTQLRQFLPIANINVGVWSQQAGFTLDQTLTLAGRFAREFSSNAKPDSRYGLDPRTEQFIREGYKIGQSGMFDRKGPAADTPAANQYEQQTKIGYPFAYEQPFTTRGQTPTVPPPGGPGWYRSP